MSEQKSTQPESRPEIPSKRPDAKASDVDVAGDRFQRVKSIFLQAADKDRAERTAFLDDVCGSDDELRQEVESLLSNHDPKSEFLKPIVPRSLFPPMGDEPTAVLDQQSMSSDEHEPASTLIEQGRFTPGMVLNSRYRIIALLGRGGFGEVYRADDLTLGQTVALKFLPPRLASNKKWLERFHNEVRLARTISHPNVCHVYDVGRVDREETIGGSRVLDEPVEELLGAEVKDTPGPSRTLYFLSMEYVDGENLASLLRRIGRLQEDKAVQIAQQLCAGLAAAHGRGVLHRDLKPTNIMIDGRGHVRITDFGLAAPLAGPNVKELRAGTPAYMAPEQITGESASVRSDIYSLGLVLYELFTGKQVFKADSVAEYQKLHTQTLPMHPSRHVENLDDSICRVILRCLEKDPGKRPGSALSVATILPGGDPLAAALRAGETPSPEMVAAAGGAGVLKPEIAWPMFGGIVMGIALLFILTPAVTLINIVPLKNNPDRLAYRAEDVISKLGYEVDQSVDLPEASPDNAANGQSGEVSSGDENEEVDVLAQRLKAPPRPDRAFGFREDQSYIKYLEDMDNAPDGRGEMWERLANDQPSAIYFWYRQSPKPMVPVNRTSRVGLFDPPSTVPGMITVLLDSTGRLLMFERVPDDQPAQENKPNVSESFNIDWEYLFEAAGLNFAEFKATDSTRAPRVYGDTTVGWSGERVVTIDGRKIRTPVQIEAAAYNNRVVYFAVLPPWQKPDSALGHSEAVRSQKADLAINMLRLVGLIFGGFLAWRNLRLGRGDRRGALRVFMFLFAAGMTEYFLGAAHILDFLDEMRLFGAACGQSLYQAAQTWLFYLALEPFVRRIWPETIISWTRLLTGKFNDPLVGRDMLIGGVAAIALVILFNCSRLLPHLVGMEASPPIHETRGDDLPVLLGMRAGLALVAQILFTAVNVPLLFLLVLLLLRPIARTKWLAGVLFVLLIPSIYAYYGQNLLVTVPTTMLLWAGATFVLLRYGVVSFVTAMVLYMLLTEFPLTPNLEDWYAPAGMFAAGVCVLLMLYGCIIAQKQRRMPDDSFFGN